MILHILPRIIIKDIQKYLHTKNIIVLHGARQVGKTSIMKYLEHQLSQEDRITHFIDLEDSRMRQVLDKNVEEFITYLQEEGVLNNRTTIKAPAVIFIDEIQYLQDPSSFLKIIADGHPELKLIVSGSSTFNIKKKFKDSLVGRTVNFEVYNLSFEEFLLFKGKPFSPANARTAKKQAELATLFEEYVLFGGYPKVVLEPNREIKQTYLQQIVDTYVQKDIRDLASIRDVVKFNRLLETVSSQSGQLLNITELSNTVNLSRPAVERYLFLLEQTYILKLVRPYHANLRAELFKNPKIFFCDTGIMQMLWLKAIPKELLGQVFETGVFSEFIKRFGGKNVLFWRTQDKKEIDFIVKQGNNILPVETKLQFAKVQASTMRYFCEKYKINKYYFIALKGEPKTPHEVYPWQV